MENIWLVKFRQRLSQDKNEQVLNEQLLNQEGINESTRN